MKPEWRRFAPLGLYLAGLALLAAAGLYIVQREWNLPLQIAIGLIVIGLALFAVLDPERVRTSLTGRQARYGSNALVITLAFIGIVVVVNYLVFTNSKRWDLTEDKAYTLAPETVNTLTSLKQPVTADAFYTANNGSSEQAKTLLDQYKFHSNGKFTYKFIDPNAQPVAARQANITQDGTVVINMNGHQEKVTTVDEEDVTGAIVRLINPTNRVVYFLVGHGEFDPDATGNESMTSAKDTLQKKNYTAKSLNLLGTNQIPADAKVIVVAGPRKPVSQNEVNLLSAYLDKGGALIVMEDPTPVTEFGDSPDPLADYLSQKWGIIYGKDFVVDPTSNPASVVAGVTKGSHPIMDKLTMAAIFPTARSVNLSNPPVNGITAEKLVSSAAGAWGETDLQGLINQQQPSQDPQKDLAGPVPLAVAAENSTTKGRVVAIGDADFASEQFWQYYGNGDFFVNSVDWAAGQESLISLTPKKNTQRVMLPAQKYALNLILLGAVFVLPGLALVSGAVVFIQRRRRG